MSKKVLEEVVTAEDYATLIEAVHVVLTLPSSPQARARLQRAEAHAAVAEAHAREQTAEAVEESFRLQMEALDAMKRALEASGFTVTAPLLDEEPIDEN